MFINSIFFLFLGLGLARACFASVLMNWGGPNDFYYLVIITIIIVVVCCYYYHYYLEERKEERRGCLT